MDIQELLSSIGMSICTLRVLFIFASFRIFFFNSIDLSPLQLQTKPRTLSTVWKKKHNRTEQEREKRSCFKAMEAKNKHQQVKRSLM